MRSGYEEVLDHLLFHKALEEEGTEKIDQYLSLLGRANEDPSYAFHDKYEASVAAAFHLVVEQSFNPWDIDLVRFSKAYLERLRRLGTVNFSTAGRIVLLAWSVLKLQTQTVLSAAEPVNPLVGSQFDSWDVAPGFYGEPEDVEFTHDLLAGEETPLQESYHREVVVPVTLLDLLDAFSQAFDEAAGVVERPKTMRRLGSEAIRGKVHRDDLEEDIQSTWDRILLPNQEVVGLSELCNGDRWDRATVFLSILYLSQMGWVELWQEDLPWGEVYLRRLREDQVVLVVPEEGEAEAA